MSEPVPLWVWIVFLWGWTFIIVGVLLGGVVTERVRRRR